MKSLFFSKKNITIIFLILLAITNNIFSEPVSEQLAMQVAKNFIRSNGNSIKSVNALTLAYECKSTEENNINYYYIFNIDKTGFVIIAGDNSAYPILGYSNEGNFNVTNLPYTVSKWLDSYKNDIKYLILNPQESSIEVKAQWQKILNGKAINDITLGAVAPLIKTQWGQDPYENLLCPYDYDYKERTVTGCPATVMAQIMKYWEYPKTGVGYHSYTHQKYGVLSANFGNTSYNWSSMPNIITTGNNPISTLMYQCGVAVEMNYNVRAEGGSGSYVIKSSTGRYPIDQTCENAYTKFFDYSSSIKGLEKINYTDSDWKSILFKELNEGRPIQYAGYGAGGHTWVCDGYDNNGYFHMNWGWQGYLDGYYLLNACSPGVGGTGSGEGTYNNHQQALIGIQPPNNSITYDMRIYKDVTCDKSTINFGESFKISTDITNEGKTLFQGEYCAAIFDSENNFIDYVEILTGQELQPNYHYTNGLTFSTTGNVKMLPGTYKIYLFYRITGGNWCGLKASSWDIYADIYKEIKVINNKPIMANSLFNFSQDINKIYQNSKLTVNIDITNIGTSTFLGIFDVSLFDLNGKFIETIGQVNETDGLPTNYHYTNGLNFTSNKIVSPPGTYLLALMYQRTGDSWYLAGSKDNYINPIKITLKESPLQADKYEPNNDLISSKKLPLNFVANKSISRTSSTNFHLGSDYDYFKVDLDAGYNYSVNGKLQDLYLSDDGIIYSVDAIFAYSYDGKTWSDYYDQSMNELSNIMGTKTIYFKVSPYYLGMTGTYSLDITIIRKQVSDVNNQEHTPILTISPNPTSDILNIEINNFIEPIKVKICNNNGNIVDDFTMNENKISRNLEKFANGSYNVIFYCNGKTIYSEKIMVIK